MLLRESWKDLRSHPLAHFLTAVALFVGVLSIVAISVAGTVVRDVFVATEEQRNGRAVTLGADLNWTEKSSQLEQRSDASMKSFIDSQGDVSALVATGDGTVLDQAGDVNQPVTIQYTTHELPSVRRLPVIQGTWLPQNSTAFPLVAVTNVAGRRTGLVGNLRVQLSTSEPSVRLGIVGVVADGVDVPTLYIPLTQALAIRPSSLHDLTPMVLAHARARDQQLLADSLETALTQIGLDPADANIRRLDHVDDLTKNLRFTATAFSAVAAIALSVAVLGMLNVGLATVRERSRELVIRRAVGATRRKLFLLVISSGLITGVFSGLAAVAVAALSVIALVPSLLDPARAIANPSMPWGALASGLAISAGAALAGSLAPAIRAARVDVAFALRD